MTDTATDTATQSDLMRDVISLESDEDSYTFMDNDPSVAWDDPESHHGRLAALYLEAGWERCYHRDGARFHFNVKVNGNARWRGYNDRLDAIRESRGETFDETLFDAITRQVDDMEREFWWDSVSWAEDENGKILRTELSNGGWSVRSGVWSCGRSGGYVNVPKVESDGETMIRMAAWLSHEVEGFNSYDTGAWVADEALRLYDEEQTWRLADVKVCPNCGEVLS